jgi:hypothetical protein
VLLALIHRGDACRAAICKLSVAMGASLAGLDLVRFVSSVLMSIGIAKLSSRFGRAVVVGF